MKLFDPSKPFYKGNLHLHTTNSDGVKTPEEAMALYQAQGYDFIAITDHRKVTRDTAFYKNMLVLSGIEWDYMLTGQAVHIVGVGVTREAEAVTQVLGPQRGIDVIRKTGGRAILAHPSWSLNTHDTVCGLRDITAAEVYNSVSTMPWNADRADSSAVLDAAAANGTLLNFVASDDSHKYTGEQFQSFTMLQAEALTEQGILDALDAGTYYASRGPRFHQIEYDGDTLRIECEPVERIVFFSDLSWVEGRCRDGHGQTESVYQIERKRFERFVRCQIWDAEGRTAWTSPLRVF